MEDAIKPFNFIKEQKTYIKQHKKTLDEQLELTKQEKQDIEAAKVRIISSYQAPKSRAKEKVHNSREQLEAYNQHIIVVSTFDIQLISGILEQLISMVECEDYVYHQAVNNVNKPLISDVHQIISRSVYMIVKPTYKKEMYNSTEIRELFSSMEAFILLKIRDGIEQQEVSFYAQTDDLELVPAIEYGKYSYVKEFIDILIRHRLQNSEKHELTEMTLLELMSEFIKSKEALIAKNDARRLLEKSEPLRQKLEFDNTQKQDELERAITELETAKLHIQPVISSGAKK